MVALKSAVILWALLAVGIAEAGETGETSSAGLRSKCPEPKQLVLKADGGQQNITFNDTVRNCTCEVDGKAVHYEDGTDCLTLTEGYNGELDEKGGKCKDGKCVYTEIKRGCLDNEQERKTTKGDQVGCAYTCTNESGEKQFNYYPLGSPCRHKVDGKYVNTTCKLFGTQTLCRETGGIPGC